MLDLDPSLFRVGVIARLDELDRPVAQDELASRVPAAREAVPTGWETGLEVRDRMTDVDLHPGDRKVVPG